MNRYVPALALMAAGSAFIGASLGPLGALVAFVLVMVAYEVSDILR